MSHGDKIIDCSRVGELLVSLPSDQWRTSTLRGSESTKLRWVPIIDLAGHGFWFGLSDQGYWAKETRDGVVHFTPGASFVTLLPWLEQPESEVTKLLSASLNVRGLSENVAKCFPFESLLICGLSIGMDYWAALSLQWLETMELSTAVRDALKRVIEARWASQKVRHRSLRLLKKS